MGKTVTMQMGPHQEAALKRSKIRRDAVVVERLVQDHGFSWVLREVCECLIDELEYATARKHPIDELKASVRLLERCKASVDEVPSFKEKEDATTTKTADDTKDV